MKYFLITVCTVALASATSVFALDIQGVTVEPSITVAGAKLELEWIPGIGTVLTVKGKVQGEPFKDPEFFRAMMSIWLGPTPVDFKLKDALLGQT